jgi:hypothetical protein
MALRKIRIDGDVAYIQLTQEKQTIIDATDVDLVSKYNWHFNKGYAKTNIPAGSYKQSGMRLHRLIMAAPEGMEVDHINMDKLDNRRSNLRLATASENQRNRTAYATNTSGYKGVIWHKEAKKWRARIVCGGRKISLGMYLTKELAYAAYCDASKKLHGDFSRVA